MHKHISIIFIILFCTTTLSAQKVIPLWEQGQIPNYQKSDGREKYPERDIVWIQNVQEPTLEIYAPSAQNANGMAILICPGGGYHGLAYDWEGTDYAKWFNSIGITAFVLKYRIPTAESVIVSYIAPMQDAQRAIRYIRINAEKYHIKTNKVGVIGSSAGGHLASSLGTHYNEVFYEGKDSQDTISARPDFMMLIYPVISMQNDITHGGSRKNLLGENPTQELIHKFSNDEQVDENTPPTFIIHSGDDTVVPVENSIRMYQALIKNKVETTMHIFPKGGHGFSLGINNKDAPNWTPLAQEWLEGF